MVMWTWMMAVSRIEGRWCTVSRFATTFVRRAVKKADIAGMGIGPKRRLQIGGPNTGMWISKGRRKVRYAEVEEVEEVEGTRCKERVEIAVVLVMLNAAMMVTILRQMVIVTVTVIVMLNAPRNATVMGANTVTKEEGRTLLIFRALVQT
jgi:hypothetical protein